MSSFAGCDLASRSFRHDGRTPARMRTPFLPYQVSLEPERKRGHGNLSLHRSNGRTQYTYRDSNPEPPPPQGDASAELGYRCLGNDYIFHLLAIGDVQPTYSIVYVNTCTGGSANGFKHPLNLASSSNNGMISTIQEGCYQFHFNILQDTISPTVDLIAPFRHFR